MEKVIGMPESQDPGWFYVPSSGEPLFPAGNQTPPRPAILNQRRAEEIKMAMTSNLKDFIASGFASILEVERVYVVRQPREKIVYIRVVLPNSTRELRQQIYAKEREIIDAFGAFEFDFGIVATAEAIDPSLHLAYRKS
jgi:hypothetical protein